ncbi:4-hydroxy-tetrahydrodipicolinate synthase [Tundrisphaera sp. TA3]|uniref:4-hydroxy-tetrahydrodipicolinate synthase n=1 Tax=Tundrisphaera sp. TA3 TaxID=3435775 RepID=UPI003EB7F78B
MASKGRMFAGCTVALITPFRDGEVDYDTLRSLVDWQIAQGTPVLSPVGTTGESPTLSHDEHERVIATVVEQSAGRAKVLPGTGSNSTAEAIRLTKFAAKAGADGALLVAPYYNRPTQEGLYAHFAKIADACDLPQVLYNIPSRTGRNVEVDTVARLAEMAPIVAIKEASGSLDQVSDLAARTDLTILSGDDSLTLPMMAVGGEGVISVVANLIPKDVMGLVSAFQSGDIASARERHQRLFPLCRDLLSVATNPIALKTAMALLGRGNGELRLPLCPPDESGIAALRRSLARYGLLEGVA